MSQNSYRYFSEWWSESSSLYSCTCIRHVHPPLLSAPARTLNPQNSHPKPYMLPSKQAGVSLTDFNLLQSFLWDCPRKGPLTFGQSHMARREEANGCHPSNPPAHREGFRVQGSGHVRATVLQFVVFLQMVIVKVVLGL